MPPSSASFPSVQPSWRQGLPCCNGCLAQAHLFVVKGALSRALQVSIQPKPPPPSCSSLRQMSCWSLISCQLLSPRSHQQEQAEQRQGQPTRLPVSWILRPQQQAFLLRRCERALILASALQRFSQLHDARPPPSQRQVWPTQRCVLSQHVQLRLEQPLP